MTDIGPCHKPLARRATETLRTVFVSVGPLAVVASAHAQEPSRAGSIRGTVLDAVTGEPLSDPSVVILDHRLDTVTGDDGGFTMSGVPAGLHRLEIVLIGYESAILQDVVVRPNRVTPLAVELEEAAPSVREAVDVTADYFSAVEEETVSTVSVSYEEIRRSPGSAGDVSRLMQVLPSVGMVTDQRNDLIVRGGSPAENLTVVDNIEISNINHFPTQGASGGVIGLLNTDLIADVRFSAGGFGESMATASRRSWLSLSARRTGPSSTARSP